MAVFGKTSLKNLEGVHPKLVLLMKTAILTTPIDFSITDGVRTTEMQKKLYAKGRSAPGDIVTYSDGVINKSNHQAKPDGYCYAVDLYPYVNGAIDFIDKPNRLKTIADHIKSTAKILGIKITWGGDFPATKTKRKGWDRPHFELKS
jgi:peptidoglycan L-alanyl-D-glutamate endopeptidase CwlK